MSIRVDVLSLSLGVVALAFGVWAYHDVDVRLDRIEDRGATSVLTGMPAAGDAKHPVPMSSPGAGDSTACSGHISGASIAAALAPAGPAIKACFDALDPRLPPDVLIHIEGQVNSDGRLAGPRIVVPFPQPALEQCLKAEARRWQFGSPEGGDCALIRLPLASP